MSTTVTCTITFCLITQLAFAASRINYEKKLREHLFLQRQDADLTTRPVEYFNHTLTVNISLTIIHFTEVNTKIGYALVNGWLYMGWYDHSLKWNRDDFGGIGNIQIPSNLIWKPDVTLYNHGSSESAANFGETLAILHQDGMIIWVPPITIKTSCDFFDLRSFPYDEQTCFFKFGSWTYDGFTVDLQLSDDNTSQVTKYYTTQHQEWQLMSVGVTRNEKYYSCCEEPYPDVTYTIKLKRNSPYYTVTLLLPSLFIMFFILVEFWLPSMSGEKLTMSVFNMIYLLILLTHLHFILEGSFVHVPGIVLFCSLSLIFATLSLILVMFTYNLTSTEHATSPPDLFMRILNGRVGCLLCLSDFQDSAESNLLTSHDGQDNMEVPEGELERNAIDDWVTLATAIDRIFFLCYCFIFIILLAYSFS